MNNQYVSFTTLSLLLAISACTPISPLPSASLPSLPDSGSPTPTPTPVSAACATDFVRIPADTTLGTSEFCLAKYEMKLALNDGTAVLDGTTGGTAVDPSLYKPESRSNGTPWVRISHTAARAECASLGTGYHLVTAKEHQAAARNIESVASNWSGGSVGNGNLYRGHSDGAISASAVTDGLAYGSSKLLSAGNGTDPYAGTGQSSGDAPSAGGEQRRTFTLTTGEVIWDLSGNARDKVDADGLGGTLTYTGGGGSTYYETSDAGFATFRASLQSTNPTTFPLEWFSPATPGATEAANFTGRYWIASGARSTRTMSRGGNFDLSKGGLFSGDFDGDDTNSSSSGGFRCAK